MKKYVLLTFVVSACWVLIQACNRPDKWAHIRAGLHEEADSLMNNDSAKNKWCNCILGQFQKDYPDGEKSVPYDSLRPLSSKYGLKCATRGSIGFKVWTPLIVSTFKKALLRSPVVKSLNEQYQEPFCECYIQELKKKYPNGLTGRIPDEVGNEISSKCVKAVMGKH
ncbi:MAG: hypothetical protein JSU01_16990 [Bacteroidetes bacterium]|nr:hypothetical protein [Bacteroidota bacterium]